MIVIDEKFLVIKEINGYLVDMILINSFRSGCQMLSWLLYCVNCFSLDHTGLFLNQVVYLLYRFYMDKYGSRSPALVWGILLSCKRLWVRLQGADTPSIAKALWPGTARHFKTDPTESVALCFGYPSSWRQAVFPSRWTGQLSLLTAVTSQSSRFSALSLLSALASQRSRF
jgi:hypothetical protein